MTWIRLWSLKCDRRARATKERKKARWWPAFQQNLNSVLQMMRLWSTIKKMKTVSVRGWRCVSLNSYVDTPPAKYWGAWRWGLWEVVRVRCSQEPSQMGFVPSAGLRGHGGCNEKVAVCDLEACSHQNLTGQNPGLTASSQSYPIQISVVCKPPS